MFLKIWVEQVTVAVENQVFQVVEGCHFLYGLFAFGSSFGLEIIAMAVSVTGIPQ